jgi:hypothetical protein
MAASAILRSQASLLAGSLPESRTPWGGPLR